MQRMFKDRTIVAFGSFFTIAGTIVLFFILAFHSAYLSAKPIVKVSPDKPIETSFELRVTTHMGDNHTFYENDVISFLVSTNKDIFLLLVYENAKHNYFQIYPNSVNKRGALRAGGYRPIPEGAEASGFRVTAPFGKERLWAFASNVQIPEFFENEFFENVPKTGFISLDDKEIDTVRERFFNHCNLISAQCSETSTTFFTVKSDSLPKLQASVFSSHSGKNNIYTQLTTNNICSHIEGTGGRLEKDSNNKKAIFCGNISTYSCSAYDHCKHTKCFKL